MATPEDVKAKAREHVEATGHIVKYTSNFASCTVCDWNILIDPETGDILVPDDGVGTAELDGAHV